MSALTAGRKEFPFPVPEAEPELVSELVLVLVLAGQLNMPMTDAVKHSLHTAAPGIS